MSAGECTVDGFRQPRITETELALLKQASEERDRLFNLSLDLLCVAGFDGWFKQVNPAWTACLGWSAEELTSRPSIEFVLPEDREATLQSRGRILQGAGQRGFENRYLCKDGSIRWLSWAVYPLVDSGRVFAVARDVTARKEAEEKLQESQALLRMASRVSRLGAWRLDFRDDNLTWSDEVRAIHEVDSDFIPTVQEAIAFYVSEDRAAIQKAVERCIAHGTPFDLQLRIVTRRGRPLWVRAIGEPVRDSEGRIIRLQGAFQDISEKVQSEEAGRQSAEKLSKVLETISDAFFTLDRQWRFTYLNREAQRQIDRPVAELLGRVIWEEFKEIVGTRFETEYRRAVQERRSVSFEECYAPVQRWVEVKAYPTSEGLAVYFRDITEQRRASEVLRISDERFRLLSKATRDAIWDWDLVKNTFWWNENFATLFGYGPEDELPGVDSWITRIHPEDREEVLAKATAAIKSTQTDWSSEYRFQCKDGRSAWVLDRAYLIRDETGRALRMIGGMTDITQRRQAEERIAEQAALLDIAHEAIMVENLDGRIIYWNKGAERIYGWSREQAMGQRSFDLIYKDPDDFHRALSVLLEKGEWQGEVYNRTSDNRTLTVEVRWTLVRDKKSAPSAILAINSDITEKKNVEAKFLRAQRMESIGTLAGGIAHDLNNVLAPILLSVEILQEQIGHAESRHLLETLERSAQRGADLVKQVLSFARGVEGQRISVNVSHVARDIEKIIRDTFPRNINFQLKTDPRLWLIRGDPTHLHQVLMNLCVNARDAMKDGGQLSISVENCTVDETYAGLNSEAKAGSYVMLTVADTGSGIATHTRERIFEPFFTTKEVGEGTGLGLSTTLAIVKSHGGFINVISEPNKGTKFEVYLPANRQTYSGIEPAPAGADLPRGGGELVLIVDDEESVRLIAKKTLERFGYRVVVAANGAEAISIYATRPAEIAVVLTDMAMPIMDGPATITALRALNPDVRVVGSSGFAGRKAMSMLRYFVPKPYTAETLLRTLHKVLHDQPSTESI